MYRETELEKIKVENFVLSSEEKLREDNSVYDNHKEFIESQLQNSSQFF